MGTMGDLIRRKSAPSVKNKDNSRAKELKKLMDTAESFNDANESRKSRSEYGGETWPITMSTKLQS